jgi:hypothetical protein
MSNPSYLCDGIAIDAENANHCSQGYSSSPNGQWFVDRELWSTTNDDRKLHLPYATRGYHNARIF